MSLIDRLFVRQVQLSKIKSILKILVISIGISGNVSAQSLDRYCLSTVGQIETTNKTTVFDPTPQLPPFIRSVEHLPELYSQPCTKFYRFFWGRCDRLKTQSRSSHPGTLIQTVKFFLQLELL